MSTPASDSHGPVPKLSSAHTPMPTNSRTGANIRQVVSAMSPSIKTTAFRIGGVGVPPLLSPAVLMYNHIVANQSEKYYMPRRHKPAKHQPYQQPISCGTKRRFTREADALKALEQQELLNNVELRTYKCPLCSGWHLTSAS